ncbi:hypothetical protein [Compostibacter hankyongensis]
MHKFLTIQESNGILNAKDRHICAFRKALALRVRERMQTDSLISPSDRAAWWYVAAEYLSDAALLYAIAPDDGLGTWLRNIALEIARKPLEDWIGPAFRDHRQPFQGHLETAHLCWGMAAVMDLCLRLFTTVEQETLKAALCDKGAHLCEAWLARHNHVGNWRGIMISGMVVTAAVLEDEQKISRFVKELRMLAQAFQPDGSYGESLQYGNYLANAMMLAYESLVRQYPAQAEKLDIGCYAGGMAWVAQSMLYRKPLSGWGNEPRPRAVNFNDSAALFRPSGDMLLHVAVRYAPADRRMSGLARWLFDTYYAPCPQQGPHDLATFGMRNDWGFLALPLLTHASIPMSPPEAGLPLTAAFSNGNVLVRDQWEGRSIVAVQAGNNDGVYAPGHLQGDLNSFMLVFNKERMLADPGHSCYRNIIHGLESASRTHNTCTFLIAADELGLQEDLTKASLLEQANVLPRRRITDGKVGPPVDRGGRLLHCQRRGEVSLVASEAGKAYGAPLKKFTRYWIQAGTHLTLILDDIEATVPVRTIWNWVMNNRDNRAVVTTDSHSITLIRRHAGLRLLHCGAAAGSGPVYAHLHDAYHPEPNQLGEGASGSALIYRFTDAAPRLSVRRLHILIADEAKALSGWKVSEREYGYRIENRNEKWQVTVDDPGHSGLTLESPDERLHFNLSAEKIDMHYVS